MSGRDRGGGLFVLALAAVIILLVFFTFPWLLGAIITFLGWLVCCFLAIILVVVILIALAMIFSVPVFIWKKPPRVEKSDYYTQYRIEDIRGMDEDPANKNGPAGRP
ncbi:MAG: hypothetical protein QCI38_04165 [Candidatus Thermoplasmatota archaeon]|nr:hypothetical protein [Candidatus Thermoplasmatota archaeon]